MNQTDFKKLITALDTFSTYLNNRYPNSGINVQNTKVYVKVLQEELRAEMVKDD